jgi:KDO2-lipid IV(A) lauroyltransferase
MDLIQRRDFGFLAYWGITMVLRRFPLAFRLEHALSTARLCARLWLFMSHGERRQVTRNLELTLNGHSPTTDLSQLVFSHYETHSWNFVVNDLLSHLSRSEIMSLGEVLGVEHLEAARAKGRGVVLLGSHYGAHPYIILALLLAYGCPVTAVLGQELRPEGNASKFYRKLIDPVRSSARSALPIMDRGFISPRQIAAPLQRNEALFILGDMHLTERQAATERHALPVSFLWGTAPVRSGPLRLPKLFGTPVLPTFSLRQGSHVIVEIEEPLKLRPGRNRDDLVADLRAYLERFEQHILAAPDQWLHVRHENVPNWIRPESPGMLGER